LAAASALFDQHKYAAAAETLETFLTQHPNHARVAAAAFTLGRCRAELKQYDRAIPAFETAVASKDGDVVPLAQLGLAEAAMHAHKYAIAVPALEAAVQRSLKPNQAPIIWYWLGQADFQLKRYAPAEEAYGHVISDYGQSEFAAPATYGAGLAALRQNRADAARQDLHAFVERYPQNADRPRARLLLAQIDLDAKRYDEARSSLESLLNATDAGTPNPKLRAEAEDDLIQALLALGDYAAATPHLEAALTRLPTTDPQRYRAALSLGHAHYHEKQYVPAVTAYRGAAGSPEKAVASEAEYWEANALLGAGKPTEAAEQFADFVVRFPADKQAAHAQLRAGDALLAAKQNERAAAAYQAVIIHYPQAADVPEARKALGVALDGISNPDTLAMALKTVTGREKERGVARLARMYLAKKRALEAAEILAALLKRDPGARNAGEVNYLLGVAYETQQQPGKALEALANAVQITQQAVWTADAQTRLAWLYVGAKQPELAEKAADAALATEPTAALTREARLALVQALLDQRKWEPALQGCRDLMEGQPSPATMATALYTEAWIREKQGNAEEALPVWERLATDYPKSTYTAEALLHLGDARMKATKYEEARERFATLVATFPNSPLVPEARYKMGSALFNLDRPSEAATEFDTVATSKSAGKLASEALYWAGVAFNKAGKKQAAIQRLTHLVNEYPQNAHVSNAKVYLAALKAGG
jgi:TolA-binding protein